MTRRLVSGGAALVVVAALTACAAGANDLAGSPGPHGTVAGFWLGLWHGLISLIAFIVSLFNADVSIYEVHNNGAPYNLGFIIGVMAAFGGGGGGARRRSKRGSGT